MKAMKIFYFLSAAFLFWGSSHALAASEYIGPVEIEQVSAIGVSFSAHQAGNMEIKIKNGFSSSSVDCDANYITTLKTSDPDRGMLSLLLTAKATGDPIFLMITDDPALTAYPGRCSLMAVSAN